MKILIVTNPKSNTNKSILVSSEKLLSLFTNTRDITPFICVPGSSNGDVNDKNKEHYIFTKNKKPNGIVKTLLFYINVQKEINSLIDKMRPDVVLFWIGDKMNMVMKYCQKSHIKTIYWIYGNVFKQKTLKSKFSFFLLKKQIESTNYLAVEAPGVVNNYPISLTKNKKILIIPIFADFSKYSMNKKYAERNKQIIAVGRIAFEKNIDILIDAFTLIAEKNSDYILRIIGSGPLLDDVQSRVQTKVKERIVFDGWRDANYINNQLNDSKLYVIISDSEGLPSTLQEAMLCGVPSLGTNVGGIPSFIINDYTGWIIKQPTAERLAEEMIRIIHINEQKLEEISQNCNMFVCENYSLAKCKENACNVVTSIVKD